MTSAIRIVLLISAIFLISFYRAAGQLPGSADKAAEKFADEVIRTIKRSDLKAGAKIAVTFFYYNSGFSDTIRTYLGVELSKTFAHALKKAVSDKNLSLNILFPQDSKNILDGLMLSYFTPPDKLADEDRFYKELLNNEKPDYYISAKYTLSADHDVLCFINAEMQPDRYILNDKPTAIIFENQKYSITGITERSQLASLNYEIRKIPEWIDFAKRNSLYPADRFFVACLTEAGSGTAVLTAVAPRLKDAAVLQIDEQLGRTIKNFNDAGGRKENAVFSGTDLSLIHTEVYYDELKEITHVFCYASKKEIADHYNKRTENLSTEIREKLKSAGDAALSGDKQARLELYLQCQPLLAQADDAATIVAAVSMGVKSSEPATLRKKVQDGIQSVQQSGFSGVDELAAFLAACFKSQSAASGTTVSLINFTYRDKGITSAFSGRLTSALEVKLPLVAGYKIKTDYNPDEKTYSICGNYWEEGDLIRINGTFKDPYGNVIGAAEASIAQKILSAAAILWKPENYEHAVNNQDLVDQNVQAGGDLTIAMWTNKGARSLVFRKGERMQITVRANKSCYIRIVDYTSTGDNFLLLDNMKITDDMVNKNYTLPKTFECGEPFGAEVLQIFAQSEPFGSLQTKIVSGFNLITDDITAINKTGRRAFKEVPEHAELKINLTSVEK